MKTIKLIAAAAFSLSVVAMTPIAAYADVCNECYGNCVDAFADDTTPGADTRFSQCVNTCTNETGAPCQSGTGGPA